MRLKVSMASADECLVSLINRGYAVLSAIKQDYAAAKEAGRYNKDRDMPRYEEQANTWAREAADALVRIFPTELERNQFTNPEIPTRFQSRDDEYQGLIHNFRAYMRGLETIRQTSLRGYTDLPIQDRLFVEDIDSFQKVRDINPAAVVGFLKDGYLSNWAEEQVQLALEEILGVSFHRMDWGGEWNDLYTANVVLNGARRPTAFLLKGPGIGKKEMTIADCGRNGDQLVRLFASPADLFVVQYIGPIADMLIKDVQGKVAELRAHGKDSHFLIIDGQDTARLLLAYGKL